MSKIAFLILFFATNVMAAMPVPTLTGPVMDQAGVLSNSDKATLESEIRSIYKDGYGPQVQILIVSSLESVTVEEFAHKAFTTWKLGNKTRDDGVLFLLSINDRKMRIEVGQGLEGTLTDIDSKNILASLRSDFKKKQYGSGVRKGLSQISDYVTKKDAVQMPVTEPVPAAKLIPKESAPIFTQDNLFIVLILTGVVLVGGAGVYTFPHYDNYVKYKRLEEESRLELKKELSGGITLEDRLAEIEAEVVTKVKELAGIDSQLKVALTKKGLAPQTKRLSLASDLRSKKDHLQSLKNQIQKNEAIIRTGRL